MIEFDIMTLFPDMVEGVLGRSIIGRARTAGIVGVTCWDIRDYTLDKNRRVDDTPYGGGSGMVMAPQPICDCFKAVCERRGRRPYVIYMSPQGTVFDQKKAIELSKMESIAILCGHYEGVDQRAIDMLADEELSIGDFVLTGGEIPAMAVVDAVCRMIPGVLGDEGGFLTESHYDGLLEYPQYTRPPVYEGRQVPEILLSGHHQNIDKWRRLQSLVKTRQRRPDMFERLTPDKADIKLLAEHDRQARERENEGRDG